MDISKELAERDSLLTKNMNVKFNKQYFVKNYGIQEVHFDIVEPPAPVVGGFNTRPKDKSEVGKAEKVAKANGEFSESLAYHTDELLAQFSDKELQFHMSSVLKPIFDLVDNSQSYNEVLSVLDSLKPTMNSAEIELKLTKLIWIAQILGSKDVRDGV
jgi:hypothetical protein